MPQDKHPGRPAVPLAVPLTLAAVLVALGAGTVVRQVQVRRRLVARPLVPSDERDYVRGQTRRRLWIGVLFVVLGAMIAGSFLSGMEGRADAPAGADRAFVRFYTAFWIVALLLVMAAVMLAAADGFATRRYGLRVYQQLREDHKAKLHRDLALHRQQKHDEREARIRRGLGEGDE